MKRQRKIGRACDQAPGAMKETVLLDTVHGLSIIFNKVYQSIPSVIRCMIVYNILNGFVIYLFFVVLKAPFMSRG